MPSVCVMISLLSKVATCIVAVKVRNVTEAKGEEYPLVRDSERAICLCFVLPFLKLCDNKTTEIPNCDVIASAVGVPFTSVTTLKCSMRP